MIFQTKIFVLNLKVIGSNSFCYFNLILEFIRIFFHTSTLVRISPIKFLQRRLRQVTKILNKFSMEKEASKKNWAITSSAFERLLRWLDGNQNSEGEKYLEIRRRLVAYFDRKNCLNPDDLADETLNRVARRLEEENIESETPAKYCYIVARFVFLESLRSADKTSVSLDDVLQKQQENLIKSTSDSGAEEKEFKENMLECLETCTAKLEAENREIIINYYFGTERIKIDNRRALAQKLGVSSNALAIRACRIREKLEICVKKCVGKK